MTEDEALAVAEVAAQCRTWNGWRRWEPVMRYGRLFTPGTGTVHGRGMSPERAGRKAYQLAQDSGLLYAEGYACPRGGVPAYSAWCLDGETVVDPGSSEPGTAYFGVALRSDYMRRNYEARLFRDGTSGFRQVSPRDDDEVVDPPVDPAADIVWNVGRDIPPWVRE